MGNRLPTDGESDASIYCFYILMLILLNRAHLLFFMILTPSMFMAQTQLASIKVTLGMDHYQITVAEKNSQ
jgi:hypothetical protein